MPIINNKRMSIKTNTSAIEIIKQASFIRQSSIIKMDEIDEDEPGSPTNFSLSTLTNIVASRGTERRNDTTYRKRPMQNNAFGQEESKRDSLAEGVAAGNDSLWKSADQAAA